MLTFSGAGRLILELAAAAHEGGPPAWGDGVRRLEGLDGREWLLVDEAARAHPFRLAVAAVAGRPLPLPPAEDPHAFRLMIASLHPDGRIRQAATSALAGRDGVLPATALAVRLLDHVPQVREEARRALLPMLRGVHATAVLGVLVAGGRREHAPEAVSQVRETLLQQMSLAELAETLLRDGTRDLRRWAFALAREEQLLPAARLISVVESDPDQWMRRVAAKWIVPLASVRELQGLLRASTVEGRFTALSALPVHAPDDADLAPLLTDRAPRVRREAQRRARRRGTDLAAWYRQRIEAAGTPWHVVAACLDALAGIGDPADLAVLVAHLDHPGPRVRAASAAGVAASVPPDEAVAALTPLLLDPSRRVAAAAARGLIRVRAPVTSVAEAWTSPQLWSRRAAWWVTRSHGGWDRVEADLRAASDPNPELEAMGRAGLDNWLRTSAATTWAPMADAQRQRIGDLLTQCRSDAATSRAVAFHAGIKRPATSEPPGAPAEPPAPSPSPRGSTNSLAPWWRAWRRR